MLLQITGPKGASLEDITNTPGIVDYDIIPIGSPGVGEDYQRIAGTYSQKLTIPSTKTRRSKYDKTVITRSTSKSTSTATADVKKKESKAEKKKRAMDEKMKAKKWAEKRKMRVTLVGDKN